MQLCPPVEFEWRIADVNLAVGTATATATISIGINTCTGSSTGTGTGSAAPPRFRSFDLNNELAASEVAESDDEGDTL